MNYIEWKNTFKKYLYLLPIKEEKETLAYFDEQYNKLNPKDLDNVENIFSDPILYTERSCRLNAPQPGGK